MKFKNMFSPIQIGPMTVKNRFVVPPMGNNFANSDGTWSDESVAYYGERAKGQFGLITIEATVVHKGAKGGPKKPCEGKTNSEIAAKLHVAESSVRTYINRMLEKTGYSNRNRLMVAAVGKRLVVPGNQLDD